MCSVLRVRAFDAETRWNYLLTAGEAASGAVLSIRRRADEVQRLADHGRPGGLALCECDRAFAQLLAQGWIGREFFDQSRERRRITWRAEPDVDAVFELGGQRIAARGDDRQSMGGGDREGAVVQPGRLYEWQGADVRGIQIGRCHLVFTIPCPDDPIADAEPRPKSFSRC